MRLDNISSTAAAKRTDLEAHKSVIALSVTALPRYSLRARGTCPCLARVGRQWPGQLTQCNDFAEFST